MRVLPISVVMRPTTIAPCLVMERLPEPCSLLALSVDTVANTFRITRVFFSGPPRPNAEPHCIEVVTKFPYDASKLLVVHQPKPPDAWLAIDFCPTWSGNFPPPCMPLFDATAWVETP